MNKKINLVIFEITVLLSSILVLPMLFSLTLAVMKSRLLPLSIVLFFPSNIFVLGSSSKCIQYLIDHSNKLFLCGSIILIILDIFGYIIHCVVCRCDVSVIALTSMMSIMQIATIFTSILTYKNDISKKITTSMDNK